jgi:type IV secretory pathway TrbF-like protein
MHRERVGEIHRKRVFEAATVKIAAKPRDCADLKRNPIAIPVFIPSFSDVF